MAEGMNAGASAPMSSSSEGTQGTEAADASGSEPRLPGGSDPVDVPGEEAAKPQPRKLKAKVDGEEVEVDEETLLRDFQKYKAGDKRLQEAAEIRRQLQEEVTAWRKNPRQALERLGVNPLQFAQEVLTSDPAAKAMFAKDPASVLKALGVDPRQWAASHYAEAIKEELMTPEERAARDRETEFERIKRENEEFRRERDEAKRSQVEARNEEVRSQAQGDVQKQVVEAIKASGATPTPRLVYQVARRLMEQLDHLPDEADLPTDLAHRALSDYRDELFEGLGLFETALPDDVLFERMPKSLVERMRKRDLEEVRSRQGVRVPQGGQPQPKKRVQSLDDLLPGRVL